MNKKILDLLNQYENVDSDSENKIEEAKKKSGGLSLMRKAIRTKALKQQEHSKTSSLQQLLEFNSELINQKNINIDSLIQKVDVLLEKLKLKDDEISELQENFFRKAGKDKKLVSNLIEKITYLLNIDYKKDALLNELKKVYKKELEKSTPFSVEVFNKKRFLSLSIYKWKNQIPSEKEEKFFNGEITLPFVEAFKEYDIYALDQQKGVFICELSENELTNLSFKDLIEGEYILKIDWKNANWWNVDLTKDEIINLLNKLNDNTKRWQYISKLLTSFNKDENEKEIQKQHFNRNENKESVENVKRESDVYVIWDLYGNINALDWNLEAMNLINDQWSWAKGNAKIIFVWDILSDRKANWFEILSKINRLRKEAQNLDGDISVLAGNHDFFMISYLLSDSKDPLLKTLLRDLSFIWMKWDECVFSDDIIDTTQGYWMIELFNFLNKNEKKQFSVLQNKNQEILARMREDDKGKNILEEICNMKIVDQIDDTQMFHTPKNISMSKMLKQYGIDKINKVFQDSLKRKLIEGKDFSLSPLFKKIVFTFLHTNNRNVYDVNISRNWQQGKTENQEKALDKIDKNNDWSVNLTVCWHDMYIGMDKIRYKNNNKLISIDTWYGLMDKFRYNKSILEISKVHGKLITIKDDIPLEIKR